ncbi:uncharacterized protein LOC107854374 [Capsicum annuum]|uniref:uncharacterized protein LOC107854374 n=1 Tax=Capsicum annuum TaxID=4072 RepID=UPI0007BEC119|nr:uncharacterized protein LOC107854374 [Capsicum annuum]
MGLVEKEKKCFWEILDEMVRGVTSTEKLFVGGGFNGPIGSLSKVYDDVHGGFSFVEKNDGEASLLDFARAIGLVVANSSFPKKEEHLIAFRSSIIVFLLLMKGDKALCKDYKVIPSENLSTQHKLLVMDLKVNKGRKKRNVVIALEIGEKLTTMEAWESRGDVNSIWETTANCIRETAREVLGVSRG